MQDHGNSLILGNHASNSSTGHMGVTDARVAALERQHVGNIQAIMDMDDQNLSGGQSGTLMMLTDGPSSSRLQPKQPGRGGQGVGRQAAPECGVPGFAKAIKSVKDPVTAGVHARKTTLKEFNQLCEKLALVAALGKEVETYFKSDFDDEAR